jgi:hypothetical protein
MRSIRQQAIAALTLLALVPALAEEGAQPPHPGASSGASGTPAAPAAPVCLDQKERRAAIESGKVVQLATAMRAARKRIQGILVRAVLCHGKEGLVYELTLLAHDGKVARLTVDAVKGTVVGQR